MATTIEANRPAFADDARMSELYRLYAKPLLHFLMRLTTGDRCAAEDLVQETLLRAWQHRDRLTNGVDRMGPWLFTVARNLATDAARARRARPTEVGGADVSWVAAQESGYEGIHNLDYVRAALAHLCTERRAVLVALYLRAQSAAEVAADLGIPVGTVKSRAYYALQQLRLAVADGLH